MYVYFHDLYIFFIEDDFYAISEMGVNVVKLLTTGNEKYIATSY